MYKRQAKQAVELAAFRGKAMADAAKGIECGMTAVMNLDRDALAKCCDCLLYTSRCV